MKRQPEGIPKGGQFAHDARDEADITLALPGEEVSGETRQERIERAIEARSAYYGADDSMKDDFAPWESMSHADQMSALHYWAPVSARDQADGGRESARAVGEELIGTPTPHGPVNAVLLRTAEDAPTEVFGVSAGGKAIPYSPQDVSVAVSTSASEVHIDPDAPPSWAKKTSRPDVWALTPASLA